MEVFISHATQDSPFIHQLARALEASDDPSINCWVSSEDLTAGDKWPQGIGEAIQTCDKVIVVVSKASIKSDYVKKEISLAQTYKKSIIPVLIDDVNLPPGMALFLNNIHRIEGFELTEKDIFSHTLDALAGRQLPQYSKKRKGGIGRNLKRGFFGVATMIGVIAGIMGITQYVESKLKPEVAPVPPEVVDRPSLVKIELYGGGSLRAFVDPRIEIGTNGKLIIETDQEVHVQILHRGAGVGVAEFQSHVSLPKKRRKTYEFKVSAPAGANDFFIYTSPVAFKKRTEALPSEPSVSRNRVYALRPKPVTGPDDAVKFGTVSYRSFSQ